MIDLPTPALIGVVHLPAMPGCSAHQLNMDEIADRAVRDAEILQRTGFDAAIIENFGDRPFSAGALSPATVAAMAVVAHTVRARCGLPIGINALRNDPRAALGIAVATGATFIRVNVHCGVYATDQGIIQGQADRTLQFRKLLGRRIALLADVHVKHATPLQKLDIGSAARELAYRGMADGLIVTGPATGVPAEVSDLIQVRQAVPDRRVFVGSGVTAETVPSVLRHCSGVIVGTSLKREGLVDNEVDEARCRTVVAASGRNSR